ncbi:class I SAM-dependent methyltransferase [Candidatus Bathyarchaeota archaeon]|nr:class I SAM-dependent methyltransferase [Candidatus Bathyarchaeota archaeon]
MSLSESLQERIRKANVALHRLEAKYYEFVHPEVYNRTEQKRLISTLKKIDDLLGKNKKQTKMALDFGAGTGNLTGKLLALGYNVTALDISKEMCEIIKKKYKKYLDTKRLKIINSPIEDITFDKSKFDLITCYSVLHHLPDYVGILQKLSVFLKKGGVMYLDHEKSPSHWKKESNTLSDLIKLVFSISNPLLNIFYFKIMRLNLPSFDYSISDYWHKKEHPLDHEKIKTTFELNQYAFFERKDYHLKRTWISNLIFPIYKYFCKPETSYWIAKK